jgi:DNA-binding NtrC family response regulator
MTSEFAKKLSVAVLDERVPLMAALDHFERTLIETTLVQCDGNITETARKLGVHRNTIITKTRQMGLQREAYELRLIKSNERRAAKVAR